MNEISAFIGRDMRETISPYVGIQQEGGYQQTRFHQMPPDCEK